MNDDVWSPLIVVALASAITATVCAISLVVGAVLGWWPL